MKDNKTLRRIIDFLLYSNLWIAICAASLVLETDFLATGKASITPLVWTVFFSTLLLYAAHRLIGVHLAKGYSDKGRYLIIRKHEWHIFIYAILSALGLAIFFFQLSYTLQVAIFISGIPALGYILPVFGNKKRIRDIHLVKIFLVALSWAYITILVPNLMFSESINVSIIPPLLERFFFVFAITLPFDIRDLSLDEFTKVKTIPSWLGIPKTKKLGYSLSFLAIFFSILSYQNNFYTLRNLIAVNILYLFTILVIKWTRTNRHDYFFTGLVDGLMLLHFLIIFTIG